MLGQKNASTRAVDYEHGRGVGMDECRQNAPTTSPAVKTDIDVLHKSLSVLMAEINNLEQRLEGVMVPEDTRGSEAHGVSGAGASGLSIALGVANSTVSMCVMRLQTIARRLEV